ncbi:carbon-nitrogen hydrolase [Candidatus Peregrinibacteria bacterium]|nr:carbon-nitrogen hydrolase [Candidatus Peregrinibacteria bacterium]
MREVTLGLVQMSCGPTRKKNLEKAIKGIEDCAGRGAQIIALPELFLAPYFCQGKDPKKFELTETIPCPTTETLGKLAEKLKVTLIVSIFEKTTDTKPHFFNSTIALGPDGKILGKYRKIHIPSQPPDLYAEDFYFESGDLGFPVFETPLAKISALICYDQWFPEAARLSAKNGAEIIFYPTAIGWDPRLSDEINKAELEAWQTIQRSHSIANNIFIAAVNRTGKEDNLDFWGTSFVSDPYGRVLAKAGNDKAENLVVKCDLDLIAYMRKEWPFLDERRIRYDHLPS